MIAVVAGAVPLVYVSAVPTDRPCWPDLTVTLRALAPVGSGLIVRALVADDVNGLIAKVRAWYPALDATVVSDMLDPDFYTDQVSFADEARAYAARPYQMVVVERDGQAESCVLLAAEEDGRILSGAMTVVSPAAYRRGLGGLAARATVGVAEAIGADLAYALAAIDNHASRKALEAAGMSLCGVVPGCERKRLASGELVWIAEALYVRAFAPESQRALPSRNQLTPAVAALLEALSGVASGAEAGPAVRSAVRPTRIDADCCFVSLRDLDAQRAAEAAGLVVLGLLPASDRHLVSGLLRYGYDALYGRPTEAFEGHHWPSLEGVPPRLAALTALVRGARPAGPL